MKKFMVIFGIVCVLFCGMFMISCNNNNELSSEEKYEQLMKETQERNASKLAKASETSPLKLKDLMITPCEVAVEHGYSLIQEENPESTGLEYVVYVLIDGDLYKLI